jgi:hypothetical protein
MIQRFHRPIATYLSTNHPVLWVLRVDVAILMAVAVALAGIPILWIARRITNGTLLAVEGGYVGPNEANSFLDNLQISLGILAAGLGIVAVLLWFGAVYRSAYKAVAPSMRIYPRVIDLFLVLALIGFVTCSIMVLLDVVMAHGDAASSYADPSGIIAKYLIVMIEPAVLLSMIFALILRWSIAAALGLTVGAIVIAFGGLLIFAMVADSATADAKDKVGAACVVAVALGSLFVPLWIARNRRNTRPRRILIALCLPLAVLAVAAIELCFMLTIDYLTRTGHIAGYQIFSFLGANQEYGPHYFFIIHSILALVFVQWIYMRWARLSLRPE